jgi:prepilin signal peptidase PulO-like enzyme (type II secretory pathway)
LNYIWIVILVGVLVYILFGIVAGFMVFILFGILVDIFVDKWTHGIMITFQIQFQKVSQPYFWIMVLIHIIHHGSVLKAGIIKPCWQFRSR